MRLGSFSLVFRPCTVLEFRIDTVHNRIINIIVVLFVASHICNFKHLCIKDRNAIKRPNLIAVLSRNMLILAFFCKKKGEKNISFIVRKKTDKYWFCYTIKLLLRQIICHFAKLTSVNVVVKKHGSVSSFFVAQLMARGSISDLTHKKAVMWIGFGDFLHTLLIKCFFLCNHEAIFDEQKYH